MRSSLQKRPPWRRLRPRAALACVALLLSACTSTKDTNIRTNVELAPAPYFDNRTGIYFPGALGPLFRQPIVELEDRSPGLGTAIAYRNASARIDVFVYDLQASVIPVGIDSQVARQSFHDALADLRQADRKRLYRDLAFQETGPLQISQTRFLHSRFTYGEDLLLKDGRLLLAGVNGQLVKIRAALNRKSPIDLDRLLFYLVQAIEQSRRNGYGGVTPAQLENIAAQLRRIELSDGLDAPEAIAIAQMELVQQERHNRFDPASARLETDQLPDSATIGFTNYPTSPSLPFRNTVRVRVDRAGNATLIEEETARP